MADQPEGLYLRIDRKVERECIECNGTGMIRQQKNWPREHKCPFCHGTGRVARRLVGDVPVNFRCYHSDCSTPADHVGINTIPHHINIGGNESIEAACEAMRKHITEMYLAGDLPPEVAANLHEEDA